jgi:hypothetical protein
MTRVALCTILVALVASCSPGPRPSPSPSLTPATPSASTTAGPSPSPSPSPVADVCHAGGMTLCALNPAVTDANVHQTICSPAWTKNLRPPTSLTNAWKQDELDAFHLGGTISAYEGDHRIPEADLGGDPGAHLVGGRWVLTDQAVTLTTGARVPANFSDEAPPSPNPKDKDETALHDLVCADKLSLSSARQQLVGTWLGPWPSYLR